MHRISSFFLQRSISLSLLQRSSTHSSQFLPKFLPSISSTCSSLPNPQISNLCYLAINPRVPNTHLLRGFCSNPPIDYGKEVNEINLKFAEAREEIDAALESKETVYYDEEAECAREAVKSVLDMFEGLLARLPESDRSALQRSMGLKMEQLKAELKQLDD